NLAAPVATRVSVYEVAPGTAVQDAGTVVPTSVPASTEAGGACSALKVKVAVVVLAWDVVSEVGGSTTCAHRTSPTPAARSRSPGWGPWAESPMILVPVVEPRAPAEYTLLPSVPKLALVQVVTPVLMVSSSSAARTSSVVTLLTAYRWDRVPVLVTVIAAVTLSPGVIPTMVMALVAGVAVRSTLPEVKVLPVIFAEAVKYALVVTAVRPATAIASTVT